MKAAEGDKGEEDEEEDGAEETEDDAIGVVAYVGLAVEHDEEDEKGSDGCGNGTSDGDVVRPTVATADDDVADATEPDELRLSAVIEDNWLVLLL